MGTANYGQPQVFTKLEADSEADKFPPLYIGYYQDNHYQSLQWVGEDVKGLSSEIIEELLANVVSLAELKASRPKKRCRILPVVPFKGFKKTPADIARENKENEKLDSLIAFLRRREGDDPRGEERLEIFKQLEQIDEIMEAFRAASGGESVYPSRLESGQKRKFRKSKPLQLSMGRVVVPTTFKEVSDEEGVDEIEEIEILPKVETPKNQENSNAGDVGTKKPVTEETLTQILEVYKCNKCNHAFEKINLFVKHFIKVHKDVIDVNKTSANFSFSNFWTKMKVKASSRRRNDAKRKNVEVAKDLHDGLSIESFLNVKKVRVVNDNIEELDLLMNCSSHPFRVEKKSCRTEAQDTVYNRREELTSESLCYQGLAPDQFESLVCDVDPDPERDEEVVEAVLMDKYQMIPLSDIKIENPFEELPLPLTGSVETSSLTSVLRLRDSEVVVGLAADSDLLVNDLLEDILERVDAILFDAPQDDEIEEIHEEVYHDETGTKISHQIYIKDFDWLPLEDRFDSCPDVEQDDIRQILEMRKLRSDSEKIEAVRRLLVKTNNNSASIKSYISKILGDEFLTEEANHNMSTAAVPRNVRIEHDYIVSNKTRKKALVKPKENILRILKRMNSKVSIAPTHVFDMKKRPGRFLGKRSKSRPVKKDLIIRLGSACPGKASLELPA